MLLDVRSCWEVVADTFRQYGSLFVRLSSLNAFYHFPIACFRQLVTSRRNARLKG